MNDTPNNPAATTDERYEEVLAAYLEAADAGWAPPRQAFLGRYPWWRDRLEAFFAAHDQVETLTRPMLTLHAVPLPSPEPTVQLSVPPPGTLPRPFAGYELLEEIGRG